MGVLNEVFSTSKEVAGQANPALNWISEKISGLIGLSAETTHLLLLVAISFWISAYINNEKGVKFWVVGGALFLFFKAIGL